MKLQQKKKDLVADIISPEQSLLKSLSKDDIVEFIFLENDFERKPHLSSYWGILKCGITEKGDIHLLVT